MSNIRTYKDNGYGITRQSIEYWNAYKNKIGKIRRIMSNFNPLFEFDDTQEYNTKIDGELGTILLSGVLCGYCGEGPNGLKSILMENGFSQSKSERLMYQKSFDINIPIYDFNKHKVMGE